MKKKLTFTQVAQEVGVNTSTVWRWATRGVKGRKLKSQLVGGRRFISRQNLAEFLRPVDEPTNVLPHDDATDVLKSEGM